MAISNNEPEPTLVSDHSPTTGVALAYQYFLDFDAGPPFTIMVMVRTAEGVEYCSCRDCANLVDSFAKLEAFMQTNNYRYSERFTLVWPRFAVELEQEGLLNRLTDIVYTEAEKRHWEFARTPPDQSEFDDTV